MKLEVPKTIRLAEINDVPRTEKYTTLIEKSKLAKIEEGYIVFETEESSYDFYAEINVNNSKLWDLTLDLLALFPDEIAIIIGMLDDELYFSSYQSKSIVNERLDRRKLELCKDTHLEWGLIFQTDHDTIELFITSSKAIKFWGRDKNRFLNTLKRYDIMRVDDLEFIDEYPRVRYPLSRFYPDSMKSIDVIKELKE